MSIIQQIRDKAAWLVFGLIALSLIGFLLMDARSSKFFGGSRSTVVGEVNGQKIEYNNFEQQVTGKEDEYKQRGYPTNDAVQQTVRDEVWKEVVEEALLNNDYASLGLDVSDKEVNDMLVGPNAIPQIRQAFTDQKTGIFDAQGAATRINQMRALVKAGPKKNADNANYEGARRFFEEALPQLIKMRLREKYMALFANTAYVPKWMIDKVNSDNSQMASVSYVNTPYFIIPDSAAKVSDAEIQDYIDKHKDAFKQEESRSIAYVTFDAAPSSADTAKLKQQLTDLKKEFIETKDVNTFLGRMGTDQGFYDGFNGKSRIKVPFKDSVFALPKGGVFGPYLDASDYSIAKLIDTRSIPDSAKARHILIAMVNPQTGQPILEDSVAKKRIDSVKGLLEHGASWDSVALQFSDDGGTKVKGGDLGWFSTDQTAPQHMVPEFNDFVQNGKKGDKGIVKSQYGYHYIEVLDQKDFEPAYKIAYLSRKIEVSPETDQAASGLASQFAGESRDAKSFDDNVQKKHYQKQLAPDITPVEFTIPGLGPNRQLVRWIYESEVGNVSEPYPIEDKYVVAVVTEINKEGIMSPAKARNRVEPLLRNKKKGEQIIKKAGSPASLDAAASAAGQTVQHADSVVFSRPVLGFNGGPEPKVVGYAFSKDLAGKAISPAIAGRAGVFFIKVDNAGAISNPTAELQQQRFMMEQQQRSEIYNGLMDAIRKLADIKDYRGKFF
jgi:peptidyl-prolyl cis-trans isomerase D